MANIRLVELQRADEAQLEAAQVLARYQEGVDLVAASKVPAVRHPFGSFLAIDVDSDEVVGTCAYKDVPNDRGEVEIAYFTFVPFEGRGFGRAMARALVERACQSPATTMVIAHTLPEENPSVRILRSIGMTFTGQVVDPEDGPVWRWELAHETSGP